MKNISLIANSGIQMVTTRIKINLQDRFKEWFHQWYDQETGEWNLEPVYEINEDDVKYYYRKAELLKGGFLANPDSMPNVFELRHYGVNPIKVDDEFVGDVGGDIFDISFSGKNNMMDSYDNQWIPVPYFFKRGVRRFTFGPLNWSRMMMIPAGEEQGQKIYDIILAFDTRATYGENQDRKEHATFPDVYSRDVEFTLCKNEMDIVDFCSPSQPWSYVNERLMHLAHPGIKSVSKLHGNQCKMAYAASYIFLISYLAKNDSLPSVKLFKDMEVNYIDVDMVIDIGNSKTTVLLVEDPYNADFNKVRPLAMLNFTDLVRKNTGKDEPELKISSDPFDMRLAFRRVNFGDFGPKNSQQFVHPSLVRLGSEANELIRKATNEIGNSIALSTYSSPKRYLWDWRPTREEWQYLTLPGEKDDHVVYLPGITSNLRSDGSIAKNNDGGGTAHFSPKSLMTLSFLEMLAQTIRQINSSDYRSVDKGFGDPEKPRKIRKIIVTCPTAMSRREREALAACARDAVTLISQFDGRDLIAKNIEVIPAKPDKENPQWYYDEATSSQLVYMFGEVGHKYKGNCDEFFSLYGKIEDGDNQPTLTVGSLDIGAGTSDLMISRYSYKKEDITTIIPEPLFYDSFYFAGDDMVKGMVIKIMLRGKNSAFRQELKNLSEKEYQQKIKDFFGRDHNFQTKADRILRKDFNIQYSLPLMYHFLELLNRGEKTKMVTYNDVFSEFAPNEAVIEGFKERTGIDVRKLVWRFDSEAVSEIVEQEFEPLLKKVATIMHAYACDVVLLSGRPSSLPPIRDIFLKYYAVSPDRLIILNNYFVGDWYPFSHNTGSITNPKTIVAMGGMIGHYASTLSNHKFVIDLDKLNRGLKSTVKYILPPLADMDSEYLITPDKNSGNITVSNLPVYLKVRQLDLDSYDGRNLYVIDFNRHKISDKIIRKALLGEGLTLSEGKVEELVKNEVESLRKRTRFTMTVDRDPDDPEELSISSILDRDDKPITESNIEIHIQSLGSEDRYWLDTGEFML